MNTCSYCKTFEWRSQSVQTSLHNNMYFYDVTSESTQSTTVLYLHTIKGKKWSVSTALILLVSRMWTIDLLIVLLDWPFRHHLIRETSCPPRLQGSQIGHKWDKSATFSDQISAHFGSLCPIWGQSGLLWVQICPLCSLFFYFYINIDPKTIGRQFDFTQLLPWYIINRLSSTGYFIFKKFTRWNLR